MPLISSLISRIFPKVEKDVPSTPSAPVSRPERPASPAETKRAQEIVEKYLDGFQDPASGRKVQVSNFALTYGGEVEPPLANFTCTAKVTGRDVRPGDFNLFGPHGVIDMSTGKIAKNPATQDDWFDDGRWT